jgi:hypothetical protein
MGAGGGGVKKKKKDRGEHNKKESCKVNKTAERSEKRMCY